MTKNPVRAPRKSHEMSATVIAKVPMVTSPPNMKMISLSVELAFDEAAASFRERPSADNYIRLTRAMLALQYWRGLLTGKQIEVGTLIWDKPIGTWTETLVSLQKADFAGVDDD